MRRRKRKGSWIIENTWVCGHCGHKNRGRDMKCANCGNPKDKDEKYVMGDSRRDEVTDSKLIQQAKAGVNWTCEYCKYDNRKLFDKCESCGADKEDGDRLRKSLWPVVRKAKPPPPRASAPSLPEIPRDTGESNEDDEEYIFEPNTGGPRTPPKYKKVVKPKPEPESWEDLAVDGIPHRTIPWARIGIAALVAMLIGLFVWLMVWLFVPHKVDASVTRIHWEYTRVLEQRETRHDSDWEGSVPSGAFNVSCSRRHRGTERCNPHECRCHQVTEYCSVECNCRDVCSDLGNGYSSCHEECSTCREACGSHEECDICYDTCDVYDDWCDYDYYAWVAVDREVTQGNDQNPHWGSRFQANRARHQRIRQNEEYTVVFSNGDDSWTHDPSTLTEYRLFDLQEQWEIEVNHAGSVWPQHEIEPSP